ncbi:Y-family DNA polymerase [Mycoplasma enhydrae]|uniref:Y-family DNA polymerase n=1 Tax=Mycoplasma enhydrae TaxID=2499220 RepID=UPI00197B1BD9|nr:DNA polymerase IV [Mycoplasma enhydrae]MBN4089407.1 DNA polymerase IV [Mycoplasma enhydrae]
MARVFLHIDMDTFFVSCERAKNDTLKNKPVVIASNLKRAIISAASYEVKKLGFKTGDPFYKVKEQIKDLVVIEPHYDLYSMMSKKIFEYIQDHYSNKIEVYSIDECFIDITNEYKKYDTPLNMAKHIQQSLLKHLKIPCSIGISYTKFLAKMSTNMAKPFGIIETKKEDIETRFYDLDIKKIFGVGKASVKKLNDYGIQTYRDLINCKNDIFLKKVFGNRYFMLIKDLRGENENKQHVLNEDIKSISNSETFMNDDSNDYLFIIKELRRILNNICNRAKDLNLEGREISVSIRHQNREWIRKSKKLSNWTNNEETIWNYVLFLFESMWESEYIRGLGIALSSLRSVFSINKSIELFENKNASEIDKIINNNNFKFEKNVLKSANQYLKEQSVQKENIKFLRKNTAKRDKKIDLEN